MGTDKALLTTPDGVTWLQAAVHLVRALGLEVCILSAHRSHGALLDGAVGVTVVAEPGPPSGPLWALSSLFSSDVDRALLVLPVDMPNLNVATLRCLLDAWRVDEGRALVAHDGERLQPLLGIYPCGAAQRVALDQELRLGRGRWLSWLDRIDHRQLTLPAAELLNANHPHDLPALLG